MTEHLAKVIQLIERAQQSAMTPEQIAEDARREAMQRRSQAMSLAGAAIRPEDVHAIVWGTLRETPHLPAVRRWLEGQASVLVLSGSVGSGKTVAACWAIAERSGSFVAAPDLVRISTDFDRADWNRLVTSNLLVVDDLGDELHPDKLGPALKLLISQRSAHYGRTILTTNEPPAALKTRYPDEKLWSRIAQSCEVVSKSGPDLRRAKT